MSGTLLEETGSVCPRRQAVVACKCEFATSSSSGVVGPSRRKLRLFWVCFGAHTHTHTVPSSSPRLQHTRTATRALSIDILCAPCLLCLSSSWIFRLVPNCSVAEIPFLSFHFSFRVIEAQVNSRRKKCVLDLQQAKIPPPFGTREKSLKFDR